jgi:four helix bundle protein
MTPKFDHEKLRVYQASLEFVRWSTQLLAETPAKAAVKDQLDRASTSVPLNLAEGNAKWTAADRVRFFKIATGSTMECAACLDVFVAKELCEGSRVAAGKELLLSVASMLVGLTNSLEGRIAEEPAVYGSE